MAGYLDTTRTVEHIRYGVTGDYQKIWYKFTITVKITSSGSITYTIVSTNNADEIKGWDGCQTSAWIEINGQEVLPVARYGGDGFPRANNTTLKSKSGELSTTAASIKIKSKILPGSDYTGWSEKWDDSLTTSTITRTTWTNVGVGSTTITDNYDNTFTITATKGANGTNNAAGGPADLYYGYTSAYKLDNGNFGTYTSGSKISLAISGTSNTRTVYAKSTTTATRGSGETATTSKAIRQYIGPSQPTKLLITSSKTRLTVKADWTLSWTAPDAANTYSPVKGYRIRLYRKRGSGSYEKLHIKDSSGKNLSTSTTAGDIYYDSNSTASSIKIYPAKYGTDIQPGDKIKFAVTAYTRKGQNNNGTILFKTIEKPSDEYVVQNAGVVQVYANTGTASKPTYAWKEGTVHVAVNTGTAAKPVYTWKEAETVNVAVNTGTAAKPVYTWKESE
jgi:hypothetical protein